MLKLKNGFAAVLLTAALLTGFVSCAGITGDDAISKPAESEEPKASDYYGIYEGNWTVLGTDYPMTAIISESTLYCSSSMKDFAYEHVWWSADDEGNFVCNGNHVIDETASGYKTVATSVTFKTVDGVKKAYFYVAAMASIADPAELTYISPIPAQYLVAGDYKENAAGSIKSADFSSDLASINASDNSSLTVELETSGDYVNIAIPSITGNMFGNPTEIPGFNIEKVTVAKTSAGYTLSIGDYAEGSFDAVNSSTEAIYTATGTVNGVSKKWVVYGFEGTIVNGELTLKIDYKYGAMPLHCHITFSSAE